METVDFSEFETLFQVRRFKKSDKMVKREESECRSVTTSCGAELTPAPLPDVGLPLDPHLGTGLYTLSTEPC